MSIVSRFFDFFKHKDMNNASGVNSNVSNDTSAPVVIEGDQNFDSMVRTDDFVDSSVVPEEYTVAEEDDEEEEYVEEITAEGIAVDDGDDMSPIIMDEYEEIVVSVEDIDKVINDPTHNNVEEYPINLKSGMDEDDEDIEIL